MKKAGYVSIIGKPNAGKSTLMNSLIGEKLSIITPKPQTTRKRVIGILTDEESQLVFVDNPGILEPRYELHRVMMDYVSDSLDEADIICLLYDITDFKQERYLPENFLQQLKTLNKPVILVLNKIDLFKNVKDVLPIIAYFNKYKVFTEIIPVSATKSAQTEKLTQLFKKYLPENDFFFDEDSLSIQNQRFFVSEIIREKIFLTFKQEVPYSTEVHIVEFKEREEGKWYISAEIIIERAGQKRIIIGEKGAMIKEIGERSRTEIEEHLQMPVFLELFVKVRNDWRKNRNLLKSYGY